MNDTEFFFDKLTNGNALGWGMPDRMFIGAYSLPVGVEVKHGAEPLRETQVRMADRFLKAHWPYLVVRFFDVKGRYGRKVWTISEYVGRSPETIAFREGKPVQDHLFFKPLSIQEFQKLLGLSDKRFSRVVPVTERYTHNELLGYRANMCHGELYAWTRQLKDRGQP